MKTTRAERHAALLASLTLLGCRDALQPVGPRVPAPSAAIEPAPPPATNECASPPVGTIWCDDFEVDRLSSYFEHLSPTTFARTAGVGAGGSYGMRAVRSEEHTSELQSHHDLVCRLLLEKKKKE